MSTGAAIVLWREEKGLSQSDLARLSGLSRAQLSAIEFERRDVTLRTLRRIAAVLNVRAGKLVDGDFPDGVASLTRPDMEEIAQRVAGGLSTKSRHPGITSLLLGLTRNRRAAATGEKAAAGPRRGRASALAMAALKSALGREQLDSLLARIDEHVRRREAA